MAVPRLVGLALLLSAATAVDPIGAVVVDHGGGRQARTEQLVIRAEVPPTTRTRVWACRASAFRLTAVRNRQWRVIEPTDTGPGPLDVLLHCERSLDLPPR